MPVRNNSKNPRSFSGRILDGPGPAALDSEPSRFPPTEVELESAAGIGNEGEIQHFAAGDDDVPTSVRSEGGFGVTSRDCPFLVFDADDIVESIMKRVADLPLEHPMRIPGPIVIRRFRIVRVPEPPLGIELVGGVHGRKIAGYSDFDAVPGFCGMIASRGFVRRPELEAESNCIRSIYRCRRETRNNAWSSESPFKDVCSLALQHSRPGWNATSLRFDEPPALRIHSRSRPTTPTLATERRLAGGCGVHLMPASAAASGSIILRACSGSSLHVGVPVL